MIQFGGYDPAMMVDIARYHGGHEAMRLMGQSMDVPTLQHIAAGVGTLLSEDDRIIAKLGKMSATTHTS